MAKVSSLEPTLLRRSTRDSGSGSSSGNHGGSAKDQTQAEKEKTQKEVQDYLAKQKADQEKIWGGSKERPEPFKTDPYYHNKGRRN
jgi:hypothetical protein